jgi:hypothetical protein
MAIPSYMIKDYIYGEGYNINTRTYKASAISPITKNKIYATVTQEVATANREIGKLRFQDFANYLTHADNLMRSARDLRPMDRDLSALDGDESRCFNVRLSDGRRKLGQKDYHAIAMSKALQPYGYDPGYNP